MMLLPDASLFMVFFTIIRLLPQTTICLFGGVGSINVLQQGLYEGKFVLMLFSDAPFPAIYHD